MAATTKGNPDKPETVLEKPAARTSTTSTDDADTVTVKTGENQTVTAPTHARVRRDCVVHDGTPHTGHATPGAKICSAHAMRYRADGTPRGE
jgi:hypothetical protein